MIVAFDADVLSLTLNPALDATTDPTSGKPVLKVAERLEYLIAELEKTKTRVIIPAPALSELLVIADESGPDYLAEIDKQAMFSVESFDARAAVEAAATRKAHRLGINPGGEVGGLDITGLPVPDDATLTLDTLLSFEDLVALGLQPVREDSAKQGNADE